MKNYTKILLLIMILKITRFENKKLGLNIQKRLMKSKIMDMRYELNVINRCEYDGYNIYRGVK